MLLIITGRMGKRKIPSFPMRPPGRQASSFKQRNVDRLEKQDKGFTKWVLQRPEAGTQALSSPGPAPLTRIKLLATKSLLLAELSYNMHMILLKRHQFEREGLRADGRII